MKKLAIAITWALAATALGQAAGSVTIRNVGGTAQADVRSATPLSGTEAVTVILHPNSASIGTSPATKITTPFSATALTGTATSSADTAISPYTSLSLAITYSAGVTGSPATCTLQPQYAADGSHFNNWGTAFSLSPVSSSTQTFEAPSNAPGPMGQAMQYVYTCGTYPTAGTFSVTVTYTTSPMVSNGVEVQSPTAANFLATVSQGTAVNLQAQVSQPTAANLNATVVQTSAANLLAEVQGTIAAGSASSNPVVIGGTDSAGNVQKLETESTATGPLRVALFNGSTEASITANGLQIQQATAANLNATVTGSVQQTGNGTFFNGQASFTTAAAFATNSSREVWVRALASNTDILWIGSSSVTTGNGFPLYPGDAVGPIHVNNSNLIYGVANSGTQSASFDGDN